jgi:hypothetical protein
MLDFNAISDNLELKADGIWYAKITKPVSYPDEGNETCMQLEDSSYWFKHRNNCILSLVKTFSKNAIFYDIGGGNGFVSQALEKGGIETVLIEPGAHGATNAKSRGLKNVICATTETCGLRENSVDAVGLFDVVEHMKDDYGFLKQNYELIKEAGYIHLTLPALNLLWSREDSYAGHFRRYAIKSAKELLRKTGFEVVFSSYLFSVLPLPIFLMRSLPSRLGCYKNVDNLDQYKKEHTSNKYERALQKVWDWELSRISRQKMVPFGSSIIIVGKKV